MSFFSSDHLIQLLHDYGNVVLAATIALECIGLPLPGESLLIAASVLAGTTHQLGIVGVVVSTIAGGIIGQLGGYIIGWSVGFRLLRRFGPCIGLTEQRLSLARALFARHGEKLVFASRFVVLLRTVAALLAGANRMPFGQFMIANIAGAIVWAAFYGFGAYFLGQEAKELAGPAGIALGVIFGAALVAALIYVRRRERQLLAQPLPPG